MGMKMRVFIILILLKTALWIPSEAWAGEQLAVLDLKAKKGVEQRLAEALSVEIRHNERFIVYDDNTVLDTRTGLMWPAKDNGENINWNDAKKYCENYKGGGFTDWRLPVQDELAKLYDTDTSYRGNGDYDVHLTALIGLTSCCLWAAETRRSKAAFFNFRDSYWDWRNQTSSKYSRVLPVRDTKSQSQ
jgi:hypothetical protein